MEVLDDVDAVNVLGFDGYMWEPEYSDSELAEEHLTATPDVDVDEQNSVSSTENDDNWCRCDQCPSDTTDKKCCWDYPEDRLHPDGRCLADWDDFRQVCLQPAVLTLAFALSMTHRRQRGSRMPDQLSNR